MNTNELQAFYCTGTLSSLSKAAARLRVSQPAITQRIKSLEKELRVELFHRKPFTLTELGKRMLPLAQRVLEAEGEFRKELDPNAPHALSWRVGVIESALHSHLMSWFAQLESEEPGLQLELTVETTNGLEALMDRGALDLAISALPFSQVGVETRPLPALPMVFVGDATLHTQPHYVLAELAPRGVITFQAASQPHSSLHRAMKARKIGNARMHAVSSISGMVDLVLAGCGVATLPRAVAERFAASNPSLRVLSCDVELPALPIHVSWRVDPAEPRLDPIVQRAIRLMKSKSGGRGGPYRPR
jgi:DNA-binding transcriptional LysR family regulator